MPSGRWLLAARPGACPRGSCKESLRQTLAGRLCAPICSPHHFHDNVRHCYENIIMILVQEAAERTMAESRTAQSHREVSERSLSGPQESHRVSLGTWGLWPRATYASAARKSCNSNYCFNDHSLCMAVFLVRIHASLQVSL